MVADPEIMNHRATLQYELSKIGKLLRAFGCRGLRMKKNCLQIEGRGARKSLHSFPTFHGGILLRDWKHERVSYGCVIVGVRRSWTPSSNCMNRGDLRAGVGWYVQVRMKMQVFG
jgi:hypothetical protein